ncbi:MAG: hypothetical protein ACREI3_02975 [Nitrospirales bacterium]
MKEKLSVTLEAPLVRFLDTLPGETRSEKLERVLRKFKEVAEDMELRCALAKHRVPDAERAEHEAWMRTMEHDQWSESAGETSGRSSS